jgi:putative tryptophan/tyrosine transport system substrate-binding protein
MPDVRRREFIGLLGGAAAWPLASSAAPVSPIPRVGVIDDGPNWDHFRQGLSEFGYVVGQNLAVEYVDRLRQAALELARLPVNVIVTYGTQATRAAQRATSTIPLVMTAIGIR